MTLSVVQAPVLSQFTATPASIYQGDPSTLAWSVTGATSLSLDNGLGTVTGTSLAVPSQRHPDLHPDGHQHPQRG